ncbi:MAG TPA: sugar transferase [Pseudobdellovibrionaceae bacterium]
MTKRFFDTILALSLLGIFLAPLLIISLVVKWTSPGPVLHWSKRVGKDNKLFLMPKFRSMKINTPQVATHLLTNAQDHLTPVGSFIRKTSLDELPQLWSVLVGDMSFVGPRPALFNQDDLIKLRTERGVSGLRPGITGWAQINGRDELPIPIKVEFDHYYFKNASLLLDLKIIFRTAYKVFNGEGVKH